MSDTFANNPLTEKKLNPLQRFILWLRDTINKHPLAFLMLIITGSVLIIFFPFIFMGKPYIYGDIGNDTENVYAPFFHTLLRKLTNGDMSMWTFEYGTGTNILSRQADVTNVFTWITFLFGQNGIKYLLGVSQILKIYVCALLTWKYTSYFKFSSITRILVSYTYAFNGYLMLWGQHYQMGNTCILLMLILISIERIFKYKHRSFLLILSSFILMISSYYFAYMILLFAGVYAVARCFHIYKKSEFKTAILKLFNMLGAILVGMLMSGIIFIPSAMYMLSSTDRVGGGPGIVQTILSLMFNTYSRPMYSAILSRLFSNNMMGTVHFQGALNYYELPQYFFTSLNIFVFVIFFSEAVLNLKKDTKQSVLKLLEFFVVMYSVVNPLCGVAFNGFVSEFHRYTYILMPLFVLWYAEIFDKILKNKLRYKYPELIVGALVSLGALYIARKTAYVDLGVSKYTFSVCAFVSVAFLIIALSISKKKNRKVLNAFMSLALTVLIVFNVGFDSAVTTDYRVLVSNARPECYTKDVSDNVNAALAYLKETDDSFYRVDKYGFYSVSWLYNDGMQEGYNSASGYNSLMNKNVLDFSEKVCPEIVAGPASCYQSFTGIYDNVGVSSALGVKYILSKTTIDNVEEYEFVKQFGDVNVYKNTSVDSIARFYTNTISEADYEAIEKEQRPDLRDVLVIDGAQSVKADATTAGVTLKQGKNSGELLGNVKADSDGWLYVAIPYESGWSATVDGKEAELLKADYGYSAVKITSGEHEINFKYETPYLKIGALATLGGLFWAVVWIVVENKLRKKMIEKKAEK